VAAAGEKGGVGGGDTAALAARLAEERREVLTQRLGLEQGRAALALERQAWQRQKARCPCRSHAPLNLFLRH
jgi:hypothetical protein